MNLPSLKPLRRCIWRERGRIHGIRCANTFTPHSPSQICCKDHQAAYSALWTGARAAMKKAAKQEDVEKCVTEAALCRDAAIAGDEGAILGASDWIGEQVLIMAEEPTK